MNEQQNEAEWNVAEWRGKLLVDLNGAKIGKLQDVYVDLKPTSRSSRPSRGASSGAT